MHMKNIILSIDYNCKHEELIDYLISNDKIGAVHEIKKLKSRNNR